MKVKSIILTVVLLCLSLPAGAQTSRGTVTGLVSDTNGAVVAGVTLTITNP